MGRIPQSRLRRNAPPHAPPRHLRRPQSLRSRNDARARLHLLFHRAHGRRQTMKPPDQSRRLADTIILRSALVAADSRDLALLRGPRRRRQDPATKCLLNRQINTVCPATRLAHPDSKASDPMAATDDPRPARRRPARLGDLRHDARTLFPCLEALRPIRRPRRSDPPQGAVDRRELARGLRRDGRLLFRAPFAPGRILLALVRLFKALPPLGTPRCPRRLRSRLCRPSRARPRALLRLALPA